MIRRRYNLRPGTTWRVWTATALLVAGAALVGATAETRAWGWTLAGYFCLLFVPALVVDEIGYRLPVCRHQDCGGSRIVVVRTAARPPGTVDDPSPEG